MTVRLLGGPDGQQLQSSGKHRRGHTILHHRRVLSITSWNVRTLVENNGGDHHICRSRPQSAAPATLEGSEPYLVDRKLDLLVKELIQETKWFGNDIWNSNGHTLLHAGRDLPSSDEPTIRREGVAIVLDKQATLVWREAREIWEAVSSRIVSSRLKVMSAGQRRPGGSREPGDL